MGPKRTPSLISKGGIRYPPLAWDEIDIPWEVGLTVSMALFRKLGLLVNKMQSVQALDSANKTATV